MGSFERFLLFLSWLVWLSWLGHLPINQEGHGGSVLVRVCTRSNRWMFLFSLKSVSMSSGEDFFLKKVSVLMEQQMFLHAMFSDDREHHPHGSEPRGVVYVCNANCSRVLLALYLCV